MATLAVGLEDLAKKLSQTIKQNLTIDFKRFFQLTLNDKYIYFFRTPKNKDKQLSKR